MKMDETWKKTNLLVRDAVLLARDCAARAHLARAWDLLQERDEEGQAKGPLPYTDEAIDEFRAAHEAYPQDLMVIHHLAVCYHARAWDRELREDPRAVGDWKAALGYWHALAVGDFWAGMKHKLAAISPGADAAVLDDARKHLDEDLLNVHVDFVRHYCGLGRQDRAAAHVQIVREARIPPAVKKRLTDRVYEAMTTSVAAALEVQAYDSALSPIEHFLGLFPDSAYLPALRRHAEIAKEWLSRLSYAENWDEITGLSRRAETPAGMLARHDQLRQQPLARAALEDLAGQMALRGFDRGRSALTAIQAQKASDTDVEDAVESYDFAANWARIAYESSRPESLVRNILPVALHEGCCCIVERARNITDLDAGPTGRRRELMALLRAAIAKEREALKWRPDEEACKDGLEKLSNWYEALEALWGGLPD